jgi:5-(carboxyamino)imidazole ribonucleotide mutase
MPKGVPVATVAIDGARNAGILAARILATSDPELRERLEAMQQEMTAAVRAADERLRSEGR